MFEGGATNYAESVDSVMIFIVGVSVVLLLGITFTMIYFVFKYSRKRNPKAKQIHGNVLLEIIWIVIPTIIVIVMFWYGFKDYNTLRTQTKEDFTVDVWGYMWGWNFEYPNGKQTDTLYISANQITKLNLESRDVNHSLYIPAYRIKEDVIAGRKNFMYLTPDKPGKYDIACAEYCGLDHSYMYTKLFVLPPNKFAEWYNDTTGTVKVADMAANGDQTDSDAKSGTDVAENSTDDTENGTDVAVNGTDEAAKKQDDDLAANSGKDAKPVSESEYKKRINSPKNVQLLTSNGCIACHTLDGSKSIGPSFMELADGEVTIKTDGGGTKKIKVTDQYLHDAIMNPDKQIVDGYRKYMMPSQKSMVNDEELKKLVKLLNPHNK